MEPNEVASEFRKAGEVLGGRFLSFKSISIFWAIS